MNLLGLADAALELAEILRRWERARPDLPAISKARLGVLRKLAEGGPATVPALAFALGRSRQATQVLVDALGTEGFVHREINPRHRRSPRVVLTERGRAAVADLRRARGYALDELHLGTSDEANREATRVLLAFREALEADLQRLAAAD